MCEIWPTCRIQHHELVRKLLPQATIELLSRTRSVHAMHSDDLAGMTTKILGVATNILGVTWHDVSGCDLADREGE